MPANTVNELTVEQLSAIQPAQLASLLSNSNAKSFSPSITSSLDSLSKGLTLTSSSNPSTAASSSQIINLNLFNLMTCLVLALPFLF